MTPRKSWLALAIRALKRGEVCVIPTDTLYGVVGQALKKDTISRIYSLRRRDPKKSVIILIDRASELARFGVTPDARTSAFLRKVWPGKVTVVLSQDLRRKAAHKKFSYLHRGARTLAFRLPAPQWLRTLLRNTGPLVAPSANIEGKPPARTIREAKKYFGNGVACYVNGGRRNSKPSTLIAIKAGKVGVLRRGAVPIRSSRI